MTDVHSGNNELRGIAQEMIREAAGRDRPDLVELLTDRVQQLELDTQRVVVCGGFKAGKSTLINGLLGGPVAAADPITSTATVLAVHPGEAAEGVYIDDGSQRFERVSPSMLRDVLLGYETEVAGGTVVSAAVRCPAPALDGGLVLLDTPPISSGLSSPEALRVLGELHRASAFVYVRDASQELSAPELDFIRAGLRVCPTMVCCLTKIDQQSRWPTILQITEERLKSVGVEMPVIPVSATLLQAGRQLGDEELLRRSGYPLLYRFLKGGVIAAAKRARVHSLSLAIDSTAQLLIDSTSIAAAAIDNPEDIESLRQSLADAQERAHRFSEANADWQRVLKRELRRMGDESRYRLQLVVTHLQKWSAEKIEEDDPQRFWLDFEGRLQRETSQALAEQLEFIRQAGETSITAVADALQAEAADLGIDVARADIRHLVPTADLDEELFSDRLGMARTGVMAARIGTGTGATLFGVLTGSAVVTGGIALVIAVGAAISVGSVWTLSGKRSGVDQRRRQAQNEVNRYLQDVRVYLEKTSNDAVTSTTDFIIDEFEGLVHRLTATADQKMRQLMEAEAAADPSLASEQLGADQRRLRELQLAAQHYRPEVV